jgi:hypothetical protein
MTKSHEKGRSEITEAAKREAMRTGLPVAEILARMLDEAKKAKDVKQRMKIIKAQKYLVQRIRKKRRGQP